MEGSGKKGKSSRQKLGENLVLQLNELFPLRDLNDVISAVKKSDLNLDVAISILLEEGERESNPKNEIPLPSVVSLPPNNNEIIPTKVEETPKKVEEKNLLNEEDSNEKSVKQVLAVIPSISRTEIIETIKKI